MTEAYSLSGAVVVQYCDSTVQRALTLTIMSLLLLSSLDHAAVSSLGQFMAL